MFSSSTSAGIAARVPYVVSTIAVLGLILSGLRRSNLSAAFSTNRPRVSSRTTIRQSASSSSTARSTLRQSGAGTTSSSSSQIRSKPCS